MKNLQDIFRKHSVPCLLMIALLSPMSGLALRGGYPGYLGTPEDTKSQESTTSGGKADASRQPNDASLRRKEASKHETEECMNAKESICFDND
jgi:hypothetical protein